MPAIWQKHLAPAAPNSGKITVSTAIMAKTGIMADSHGHVQRLSDAIAFLKAQNCLRMVHLGDICDSTSPQTADACVALMQNNNILAVKGNNDHAISRNDSQHTGAAVSTATINYLRNLPLLLTDQKQLFTHSLPFEKELGLSSMVGDLTTENIVRFFKKYPGFTLFRGHSHSPEMIRSEKSHFTRSPLVAGKTVDLNRASPMVFTCGALTDGHCLIIEPDGTLTCLCF
jgi:predicted phosphodiesterase